MKVLFIIGLILISIEVLRFIIGQVNIFRTRSLNGKKLNLWQLIVNPINVLFLVYTIIYIWLNLSKF